MLSKKWLSRLVALALLSTQTLSFASEVTIENGVDKLGSLIEIVGSSYVKELEVKTYLENSYRGLFDALDRDSLYYNEDEYERLNDVIESKSISVGLNIEILNDEVVVTSVFKDSSAQLEMVVPGDVILKINKQNLEYYSKLEIDSLLSGAEGTSVSMEIKRRGITLPEEITLVREKISSNQTDYNVSENGIGYLKIYEFSQGNMVYLDTVVSSIKSNPLKALVIDVRNNFGGEIEAIASSIDLFTPKEKLMMKIEYRALDDKEYQSSVEGLKIPIVILTNERTAGGAEIFAGTLQDLGVAKIVGNGTFGDAKLQWVAPFEDGSGMRLTVGTVFTANHRNLDGVGLYPNIQVENEVNELSRIYGAFAPMNSIKNSIIGMKDKDTLGAQQRLNYLGFSINESGVFNKETELALAKFQLDNKLLNSGILNWETKAKLDERVHMKANQVVDDVQLSKAYELLTQ